MAAATTAEESDGFRVGGVGSDGFRVGVGSDGFLVGGGSAVGSLRAATAAVLADSVMASADPVS